MKLSIVIIIKNEQEMIEDCLKSIGNISADKEIVVVDDFSQDQTAAIAKRYTDKVIKHPLETLGKQKQFALEQATGEWVLSLDADERVSTDLGQEIAQVLEDPQKEFSGYKIGFTNFFGQKPLKETAEQYSHLRLVKRTAAHFTHFAAGESLQAGGLIGELQGKIEHYSYRSILQVFRKFALYAKNDSLTLYNQGQKVSFKKMLFDPIRIFLRRFVKGKGYVDGLEGLILAKLFSLYAFLQQFDLLLLQFGSSKKEVARK